MGCSSSKSTKSLPVIVKHQEKQSQSLNPHNEDEVAEIIELGNKKSKKEEEALDNLSKMKKDESKTTLAEVNSIIKPVPVEYNRGISLTEKPYENNSIINISSIPVEKPNFEKVEHKFEFDLDLEEKKDDDHDHNMMIDSLAKELNEI